MPSINPDDENFVSNDDPPALPSNVFLFSPASPTTAKALLNGDLFSRLTAGAQTKPEQLADALSTKQHPELNESFYFCHRNVILIFDRYIEGEDLQDTHHEHFRSVCLALKDADISLNVVGCVFDVSTALKAGYQFEELSSGSVMVVDIMGGNSGSDDGSERDSDDNDSDDQEDLDTSGIQLTSVNENMETSTS